MCTCVETRPHSCLRVCSCRHIYIYTRVHNIYTCIHAYVHIHMRIHIECRKVFLPRLSNRWRPHQTLNFGASSKDPLHPHLHSHLPPHPHIVNMETNLHFALKTRKKALCGFNGLGARDVVRPFQTLCQHFQHHIHGAERMCAREWRQRNKRNRDRGTKDIETEEQEK